MVTKVSQESFWSKIKEGILAEKGLQKHLNPSEELLWLKRSMKSHFGAKSKEVYWLKKDFRNILTHLKSFCGQQGQSRVILE